MNSTVRGLLIFIFLVTTFLACVEDKRNGLFEDFNKIYTHVIEEDNEAIVYGLDAKSKDLYMKLTSPEYLNIDSILVLGRKNNMRYSLVEYLALYGDKIKETKDPSAFFDYLGEEDVSIFSWSKGYYIEKEKSRMGSENFISLLIDDLAQTKRSWVQMTKEGDEYKLDLVYLLKIHERSKKPMWDELRASHPKKTPEDALRHFYWQNEGSFTEEYQEKQKRRKAMKMGNRALLLETYRTKGKIE